MTDVRTLQVDRVTVRRGWVVAVAAAAIILGIVAFLVPTATMLTIAIVFGIFLIVSGVEQVVFSFTSVLLPTWARWLTGLLGGLTLVAGVLTLSNPWASLTVLGIVLGAGWIFGGVSDLVERSGRQDWRRWLPIVSGIVSIIAGILAMVMPLVGIYVYTQVAAILLVVIGVATLLRLSTGVRAAQDARIRPTA